MACCIATRHVASVRLRSPAVHGVGGAGSGEGGRPTMQTNARMIYWQHKNMGKGLPSAWPAFLIYCDLLSSLAIIEYVFVGGITRAFRSRQNLIIAHLNNIMTVAGHILLWVRNLSQQQTLHVHSKVLDQSRCSSSRSEMEPFIHRNRLF